MTEHNPTDASARRATSQPPEHFVAWGRLFGGLAVSIFGALGLHLINNKDANAFSIVASVAGLVLSGWGFAATNLSPKARREDVLWAWLLFGLLLATLAGNAYYNRRDYGLAFIGIELIACGIAAALALVAYALAGFVFRRGSRPDHERRGWRMVSMMACGLVFWPLLRWPLLALALSGAIGPGEQNSEEAIVAKGMRRDMPEWLLRWAVHQALHSAQPERRGRAVTASAAGKLLDTSELTALILGDEGYFVRIEALRTLANQDGKSAAAAIMETVKRGTALSNFFFQEWLSLLSPEQIETLFQSPYAESAVAHAYQGQVAGVMFAAVKKFSLPKTAEMCDKTAPTSMRGIYYDAIARLILTRCGSREQAELFNYWEPSELKGSFYLAEPVLHKLWPEYRSGARKVYAIAFRSKDFKVLDAAYRNLLATLTNPNAVRAIVEPKEGSPEDVKLEACKKLAVSVEAFLNRRIHVQY